MTGKNEAMIELIEKLKDEHARKQTEANEALCKLVEAQDRFARQLCPHRIGDVVPAGRFHSDGLLFVVDEIDYPLLEAIHGRWVARGRVIKADGKPGKRTAVRDEADGEQK